LRQFARHEPAPVPGFISVSLKESEIQRKESSLQAEVLLSKVQQPCIEAMDRASMTFSNN
jgi:hypothetical protein